jgi:long-chain fatty acid transport protein
MLRGSVAGALLVGACLVASAAPLAAQGYAVYEQSACMTGRGGAGVASPCADASAANYNPAGLSFDTVQLGLGGALVSPRATYTAWDTNKESLLNVRWYPVPNVFASAPIGKRLAAGIGIFAPYGLTTDWPSTSIARFLGYKSLVQGIYVQPTLAFKVNDRLSFGGGVDVTRLNLQLLQHLDLSAQTVTGTSLTFRQVGVPTGTDFAQLAVNGHGWSAGFQLGALLKATDRVSLGVRYLGGQQVDIDNATLESSQIPTGTRYDAALAGLFLAGQKLASQTAKTSMPLPAQVVGGVAVQATPRLKLLLDYQWTNWSAFEVLPVDGETVDMAAKENCRDTHAIRFGTEYVVNSRVTLRAGFDGHGPATPASSVTPNLPEGTRYEYSAGFSVQWTGTLGLDVGYLYMDGRPRPGRTTAEGANDGTYVFKAHIPTVMFRLQF